MLDKMLEKEKPWEIIKKDKADFNVKMNTYVKSLIEIVSSLTVFMPKTPEKIKKALKTKKAEILFPRINTN